MGIFDALCEYVLEPVGNIIVDTVEGAGRCIDSVVTTVVIEGIGGGLDKVIDVVSENPGKTVAVVAATVATGGVALAYAAPIAATLGSTGILGAAGTGAAIDTLSGIYLANASLAALGGGTLAAGGAGMAGGTMVVAAAGATTGAVVSGGIAAATSDS